MELLPGTPDKPLGLRPQDWEVLITRAKAFRFKPPTTFPEAQVTTQGEDPDRSQDGDTQELST